MAAIQRVQALYAALADLVAHQLQGSQGSGHRRAYQEAQNDYQHDQGEQQPGSDGGETPRTVGRGGRHLYRQTAFYEGKDAPFRALPDDDMQARFLARRPDIVE